MTTRPPMHLVKLTASRLRDQVKRPLAKPLEESNSAIFPGTFHWFCDNTRDTSIESRSKVLGLFAACQHRFKAYKFNAIGNVPLPLRLHHSSSP